MYEEASKYLSYEQMESLYDVNGLVAHFKKLFGRMNYLESVKQTPPRFTRACLKLAKHLDIRQDYTDKEAIESLRKSLTRSEEVVEERV